MLPYFLQIQSNQTNLSNFFYAARTKRTLLFLLYVAVLVLFLIYKYIIYISNVYMLVQQNLLQISYEPFFFITLQNSVEQLIFRFFFAFYFIILFCFILQFCIFIPYLKVFLLAHIWIHIGLHGDRVTWRHMGTRKETHDPAKA